MSHFFIVSLVTLFFLCFLEKRFANETTWEERYHLVSISSLLPSSSCSFTKGPKRKASLDVVPKHGPCSQLNNNGKASILPTHSDILSLDKERVNYIHSKLSSDNLPAIYGNLIGTGNYFVVVGLGTPKRNLSLVFDTGSDLTWTQCQPCARPCYTQQDEIFDPSKSTSYCNISCTSSDCTQLISSTACKYGMVYGDGSFSEGYFSRERLTVTPTDAIDGFFLGCGENNQGLFGMSAGILGLGRHPISFVQQTAKKYNKIFSYCLPSTSSVVGHLTFGATDNYKVANNTVKYTPLSTISRSNSFYGLDIVGISIAKTKLSISSSIFSSGGAIIDSGTVITRLPPSTYASLRNAFRKEMAKYPAASGFSILDTCYDLRGRNNVVVPKISFVFGGGVTVELGAHGVLFTVSSRQVCLAFAANRDDSDITIFGNVQQRTLEVVYDVGGGKIGFGPNGCK
ncbi:putative nepenthesin [Medicago truncatula]|uniref:Putative nepenthesin n=1 Tax=Medicago truncatula TaxID=3880 RepID=A0A396IT97_MEDTR|nr:putative nepenthesin [Medicago truncatula]